MKRMKKTPDTPTPPDPCDDASQEPDTDDDVEPSAEQDAKQSAKQSAPSKKDDARQTPLEETQDGWPPPDTKQAPSQQTPDSPRQQAPRLGPKAKSLSRQRSSVTALEVVLRSFQMLLEDVAELAERVEQLELSMTHVANRTYAPSNVHVRQALTVVQRRAHSCLSEMANAGLKPPPTSPAPEPSQSRAPEGETSEARRRAYELGTRVMEAAATARRSREYADRLRVEGAAVEEITEADRVADESEARAVELAESARVTLLG